MTENVQNSTFDTTNNKWLDVWNEFKNHKGALAGAIIFALIVILVLLGPFVWPYEANGINTVSYTHLTLPTMRTV